jgi:hypothetical protein
LAILLFNNTLLFIVRSYKIIQFGPDATIFHCK